MTKERARELFNIPETEEIPDFVKYLSEHQPKLSEKDYDWALSVANRWVSGQIKVD